MIKLQELFFKTELQLKIFFIVLNTPKGIVRDKICQRIQKPKTTILNNLDKLRKRIILVGQELNIEMPYIKKYNVKLTPGKGRTCVLFYVPRLLRNSFMNFYISDIKILRVENN